MTLKPDPAIFPPQAPAGRVNPVCPWLPEVTEIHDFRLTRRHGGERGAAFYQDALRYAQALWISGKPAQAVLQLDKAWMADLSGAAAVLQCHPPPYQALVWMLRQASAGDRGFMGNPVRHFQHLASRMSGPRREIRSWRAWLCLHVAEEVLPAGDFLRDGRQIAREGLWIPNYRQALAAVGSLGWPDEMETASMSIEGGCHESHPGAILPQRSAVTRV